MYAIPVRQSANVRTPLMAKTAIANNVADIKRHLAGGTRCLTGVGEGVRGERSSI